MNFPSNNLKSIKEKDENCLPIKSKSANSSAKKASEESKQIKRNPSIRVNGEKIIESDIEEKRSKKKQN